MHSRNTIRHPSFNNFPHENSLSSSEAFCQNCAAYEEDIAILQDKLMETHNKLIDQIDLCREQEVKLIRVMQSRKSDQENDVNEPNLRERRSTPKKGK